MQQVEMEGVGVKATKVMMSDRPRCTSPNPRLGRRLESMTGLRRLVIFVLIFVLVLCFMIIIYFLFVCCSYKSMYKDCEQEAAEEFA